MTSIDSMSPENKTDDIPAPGESPTPAAPLPVALVTGGARRIGAAIVRALHGAGMRVAVHYRESSGDAQALCDSLAHSANHPGAGGDLKSVMALQANLTDRTAAHELVMQTVSQFGRLDILINNASSFYPAQLPQLGESEWRDLLGTNLEAPLWLSQAAAPHLAAAHGAIVNIADVYGIRPRKGFSAYCVTKAALIMLTRALSLELGPAVRVNAVAPGAILWPEVEELGAAEPAEAERQQILEATSLARRGEPQDIAGAVLYLVRDAGFVTGHVLPVDGGRNL